ncbi:N-terminal nucleophile aminohydrolase [Ascodesmis nigricans]|uniref:Proteasome subunit alpha type n=1 Tax=Ascodesmis nigricans TaxID=341454 RepID=A0A4S2N868_9PEZI|nr:N-terminal nucleophile aminohydrolase [Ascodesmis nigricans]
MFRNNYDNDSVTFSPQGRIFQVEYALEAIKQGSAAVGLVSKTHAVLVALKRNAEELGSYQKKIIGIDSHLGIALAGLAPDARVLSNFMRSQSMSSRLLYNRPIPVSRVVNAIADKAQVNTQHYGRRPYGVGLLVAGVDETGPHLWEFQPSGMVLEYRGTAIGARSQSARTYLERNFESFENASKEELVLHGLKALRDSLAQDKELTTLNVSLAVVGIGKNFKLYDGDEVAEWLEKLGDTTSSRGGGARPSAADAPAGGAPVTTGDTEAGAMDTSE